MNIFHDSSDNRINSENMRKDWVALGVWLLAAGNCALIGTGGLGGLPFFLIK